MDLPGNEEDNDSGVDTNSPYLNQRSNSSNDESERNENENAQHVDPGSHNVAANRNEPEQPSGASYQQSSSNTTSKKRSSQEVYDLLRTMDHPIFHTGTCCTKVSSIQTQTDFEEVSVDETSIQIPGTSKELHRITESDEELSSLSDDMARLAISAYNADASDISSDPSDSVKKTQKKTKRKFIFDAGSESESIEEIVTVSPQKFLPIPKKDSTKEDESSTPDP
ncbi:hypothetical protein CDAR_475031 [Caerostris darwini]|uniref:Uncharacterized protein n=1 Tax=Caerostris darwini TaxID=1538125 RepID=A0AAV4QQS1_9ARAC|nr:hypothetical protein CDAR_475031 [Caerostris darwini]